MFCGAIYILIFRAYDKQIPPQKNSHDLAFDIMLYVKTTKFTASSIKRNHNNYKCSFFILVVTVALNEISGEGQKSQSQKNVALHAHSVLTSSFLQNLEILKVIYTGTLLSAAAAATFW